MLDTTNAEAAAIAAPFNAPPTARSVLTKLLYEVEIEWLSADEAVATWFVIAREGDGAPVASLVTVEFEPADPGVGYFESYWHASGDAPKAVLDRVAEDASLRAVERYDDSRDADRDDGYRHSDRERWAL